MAPTNEEMAGLYNSLSDRSREWLKKSDDHESASHNWRKTPKGLRLIDYAADPFRTAWGAFLRGASRELGNKAATITT